VAAPPRLAAESASTTLGGVSLAGITLDKLLIIAVLAAVLIGPERLPALAERLGALVRGLRDLAGGAKERMREEMGPEFDEVDWRRLDPRQYDPRRIVMDALRDDPPPRPDFATAAAASSVTTVSGLPRRASGPMRFDDEAT
jgi:sec-independent protein translocase protein TatB